jgi:universal stress protein F
MKSGMKRMLVCLDASPRAPFILQSAVELAGQIGASVHLFRAVTLPSELPSDLYTVSPNELPNILMACAGKELLELAAAVPADRMGGVLTHVGSPWDGICTAARTHDIDLIVIGSHGYSALDRLLGTTAAKVVNHADRSVLIVRSKA